MHPINFGKLLNKSQPQRFQKQRSYKTERVRTTTS